MQVTVHRLTVVGAIALSSAVVGVLLGNFVAASERRSGAEELSDYSMVMTPQRDTGEVARSAFTRGDGPSSYECEGCDAHLYPQPEPFDESYADSVPYPDYGIDSPEEPVRTVAPVTQRNPVQPRGLVEDESSAGVGRPEVQDYPMMPVPVQAD